MNDDSGDNDLRARFGELRKEVSSNAPGFKVPSVATRRKRRVRWIPAAGGLAAAAVAAVLVLFYEGNPPPVYDPGLGSVVWTAPTDFLLETPGRNLLRSVPRIGVDPRLFDPVENESIVDDTVG